MAVRRRFFSQRRGVAAALFVGALAFSAHGASALARTPQAPVEPVTSAQPVAPCVAEQTYPFALGEKAEYQVKLGALSVGSGSMQLVAAEQISGHRTLRARLKISGGIPFARVDDTLESWIDPCGLFSRRFHQDTKEVNYKRNRTYDFDPERRTFRRLDNGETGTIPTDKPLDDVSFLYFARTLPLKVGETYELNRYFQESGNPVVLKVLRKETVKVPAGTFNTIVVRPIIQTKGLFAQGGEAEVYFSDDARRIPVMLRSKVPVVGSLSLHLRSFQPGGARGSTAPEVD
jgi:hypothetical protein